MAAGAAPQVRGRVHAEMDTAGTGEIRRALPLVRADLVAVLRLDERPEGHEEAQADIRTKTERHTAAVYPNRPWVSRHVPVRRLNTRRISPSRSSERKGFWMKALSSETIVPRDGPVVDVPRHGQDPGGRPQRVQPLGELGAGLAGHHHVRERRSMGAACWLAIASARSAVEASRTW